MSPKSCLMPRMVLTNLRPPALVTYTRVYETNRSQNPHACLVHPGVRYKKGPAFYEEGLGCQLYLCHLNVRNTIEIVFLQMHLAH